MNGLVTLTACARGSSSSCRHGGGVVCGGWTQAFGGDGVSFFAARRRRVGGHARRCRRLVVLVLCDDRPPAHLCARRRRAWWVRAWWVLRRLETLTRFESGLPAPPPFLLTLTLCAPALSLVWLSRPRAQPPARPLTTAPPTTGKGCSLAAHPPGVFSTWPRLLAIDQPPSSGFEGLPVRVGLVAPAMVGDVPAVAFQRHALPHAPLLTTTKMAVVTTTTMEGGTFFPFELACGTSGDLQQSLG